MLIYIHKEQELDDVERLYPGQALRADRRQAAHSDAVKKIWGERVTTVFVKQGHYAFDIQALAQSPKADIEIASIGDLSTLDLTRFLAAPRR